MISFLLSARPSYAKLKPILDELPCVIGSVEVVAAGSALLHRYGRVVDQVRRDFHWIPVTELHSTFEGATVETSVKETAALMHSLVEHYARVKSELVVVIADRHETVAASIAAAYLNIPVAHIQGGEKSGNIDDRVRDANSSFAKYHFPSTHRAAMRLSTFVQRGSVIYPYGCPSIDLAKQAMTDWPVTSTVEFGGTGPDFDTQKPFVLLLLHPETENPGQSYEQMRCVVAALRRVHLPRLVLWPGQDAGQEGGAKALRETFIQHPEETWHATRTIPPHRFLRLLSQPCVLVGNSSAGIREASFLGTPVVNIGQRQQARERAENVLDVPFDTERIVEAIQQQRAVSRYESSTLYGKGDAGKRIAAQLRAL